MITDPQLLVDEFIQVASIAQVKLHEGALKVKSLPAPHEQPTTLPKGNFAVYVFEWTGRCLKVGKVGPKSHARYTSQHYNPASSNSNLAKSILAARNQLCIEGIDESNVGKWIMENTDRFNFLLDSAVGMPVLTLLESFLQCRLRPEFEGFASQR